MLRTAFYPCCAKDILEPLQLLRGLVDEVVFCDNKPRRRQQWATIIEQEQTQLNPRPVFIEMDMREAIATLDRIDVLFYRGDSEGEGGSGVYVLGQKILPQILGKFPPQGGYIITDGSNSGHRIFKRMIRPTGYSPLGWGWHMKPADEQPYLEKHRLHMISVIPVENHNLHNRM